MLKQLRRPVFLLLVGLLMSATTWLCMSVQAQDLDGEEKGIKSDEVVKRSKVAPKVAPPVSAAKSKTSPKTAPKPPARPRYTYTADRKRPPVSPAAGLEYVRLGLTMFRYEPPGSVYRVGGDGAKEIIQEGEEIAPTPPKSSADWQPADWSRATPQTQFAVGQVVRLCFEPLTQAGYLYVIVQEQYADGSTGTATLLFPTLKTNGGDNYMQPNQRFWLPRAPSYFRLTPSKSAKKHIGELLTVVISPEPPDKILPQPLSDKAMPLTPGDVARLTQGSNGEVVQMNLDGGAGQKQTASEAQQTSKGVNQEGEEALNEDDPLPQTVYEARRKPGQPVIMRVPLHFRLN